MTDLEFPFKDSQRFFRILIKREATAEEIMKKLTEINLHVGTIRDLYFALKDVQDQAKQWLQEGN